MTVAYLVVFFMFLIVGSIVGYILSFVLNPLLGVVVFFLGFTLGLDFLLPWELSILIIPVILVGYTILRNRILKKQWLEWWEDHENTDAMVTSSHDK